MMNALQKKPAGILLQPVNFHDTPSLEKLLCTCSRYRSAERCDSAAFF